MSISVQTLDFDAGKEIAALYVGTYDVGAVASFLGVVRQSAPSPAIGDGTNSQEILPVGAGETNAKSDTTIQQGGRAQDALRAVACGDTILNALTLEHYPGMTEGALEAIATEAKARWQLHKVRIIHRVGELQTGEQIVFVGVAAAHRGEAFAACEFIMDYLKTQAPFWKKESDENGTRWVDAKDSDDLAAARWQ